MKISKDQLKRIIKEELDDASAHTIATGGETIENPKMPTGFGHYAGKGRYEDWNTAGSGDRAREEDLESIRLAGDIGEKPEPQQRYDISDETGAPVLRSDLDDALASLSKDQVEQIIREELKTVLAEGPIDDLKSKPGPLDNLEPFDFGKSPLAGLETKPPPAAPIATDAPAVTTAPTPSPPVVKAPVVKPIEVDQPAIEPVDLPPIELPDEISSLVPEGGSAGAWEIGDDPQSAMDNADMQAKARYKGPGKGRVVSRKQVGNKLYSVYGPAADLKENKTFDRWKKLIK